MERTVPIRKLVVGERDVFLQIPDSVELPILVSFCSTFD